MAWLDNRKLPDSIAWTNKPGCNQPDSYFLLLWPTLYILTRAVCALYLFLEPQSKSKCLREI